MIKVKYEMDGILGMKDSVKNHPTIRYGYLEEHFCCPKGRTPLRENVSYVTPIMSLQIPVSFIVPLLREMQHEPHSSLHDWCVPRVTCGPHILPEIMQIQKIRCFVLSRRS